MDGAIRIDERSLIRAPIWLRPILPRRLADLLLFGVTFASLVLLFLQTPALRLVDWIYVLQHLIVLAFALTRLEPLVRDNSVASNISVVVAYLYPYAQVICLRCWPGKAIWSDGGLLLVTFTGVCTVFCLLTIGTRFGIRPALRGLVTSGPYRQVRHPLYLSYLIADVGYNLQLWSPITLFLLLLGWSAMVYRIVAEERVLAGDDSWRSYVELVPYRLIPGVW